MLQWIWIFFSFLIHLTVNVIGKLDGGFRDYSNPWLKQVLCKIWEEKANISVGWWGKRHQLAEKSAICRKFSVFSGFFKKLNEQKSAGNNSLEPEVIRMYRIFDWNIWLWIKRQPFLALWGHYRLKLLSHASFFNSSFEIKDFSKRIRVKNPSAKLFFKMKKERKVVNSRSLFR